MSSSHVATKVRARLVAAWGATTPIVSDIWLLSDSAPPGQATVHWVAPDFGIGGFEEQITVGAPGNNRFREDGTFQIHVFGLAGNGETKLREYAETIRGIFRGQTFDGIRCYGADPPSIGFGHEDGRWLRATVAIDYEYDITA